MCNILSPPRDQKHKSEERRSLQVCIKDGDNFLMSSWTCCKAAQGFNLTWSLQGRSPRVLRDLCVFSPLLSLPWVVLMPQQRGLCKPSHLYPSLSHEVILITSYELSLRGDLTQYPLQHPENVGLHFQITSCFKALTFIAVFTVLPNLRYAQYSGV